MRFVNYNYREKKKEKGNSGMKKLLCLAASLVFIFALASCSAGVSVPYRMVQLANRYSEIFDLESGIAAFREKLTYPDFEYELYCETAKSGKLTTYNISEKTDGYTMSACDGTVVMERGGKKYLLLIISGTYSGFADEYADFAHPLDAGSHYQVSSKKRAEGGYEVVYKAEITPQMAGELSEYGVVLGEYIFSHLVVDEKYRALSIEYSTGKGEGERKLLTRTFEYYDDARESFENMPKNRDAKVKIVYTGGRTAEFAVPEGYHIGFYMPDVTYEFYTDEDFKVPFDADNTAISGEITLYAKAIGKKA